MITKQLQSSGVRRLGLRAAEQDPESHQNAVTQHHHTANRQHAAAPPPQQQQQRPPQQQSCKKRGSRAQALSAFRSLVEGASYARVHHLESDAAQPLQQQQEQTQQQGGSEPPRGAPPPPSTSTATAAATAAPETAALKPPVFRPSTTATATAARAAAAPTPPCQLIPKATKDLDRLQQQLASRTLTYLYQFDGLLSTASVSLGALAAHLVSAAPAHHHSGSISSATAGQALLMQLKPQDAAGVHTTDPVGGHNTNNSPTTATVQGVLDLLLQLCTAAWEVEGLLLQHHHAAEPQNTIQQAGQLHAHARTIWQVWEAYSSSTSDSTAHDSAAADGMLHTAASAPAADGDIFVLTEALCTALAVLSDAASAWAAAHETATAEWCYQQLRKHLLSVAAAGANEALQLDTRRALQRLQFSILGGNLCLAARQGLQGMWANLTQLVQQLLQHTVLEHEETLGASLSMAGALADAAASMMQANSRASNSGSVSASDGGAGSSKANSNDDDSNNNTAAVGRDRNRAAAGVNASTAVKLLEFTAQLLSDAKQRATSLEQQQHQQLEQQHQQPGGETAQGPLTQQVAGIQQQVLHQLAQAYLSCNQPGRVLECISLVHGLSTGCTPPPSLLQLSSLALLQQGKMGAAAAQLCAWLQQGGQSTEEACAAVRSFLVALHSNQLGAPTAATAATDVPGTRPGASSSSSRRAAEDRAAAVRQVAAAAAEHCRSDPSVAVEVVLQLLVEQGSGSTELSLEKLAVQLLSIEEVSQLLHTRPEDCRKCHVLLHHKGAAHYAAHRYLSAIELLTPAVFFATTLTVGKSARLLGAALIKSDQPGRALEYVGLAEQQERLVTGTGCVIRLQAALQLRSQQAMTTATAPTHAAGAVAGGRSSNAVVGQPATSTTPPAAAAAQQDESGADALVMGAVKDLAAIPEFNMDTIQAAFTLCMQHNHPAAAWQVLLAWRDAASGPQAPPPPAAPSGTGAASTTATTATAPTKLRRLRMLSLMQHIAAGAGGGSNSSSSSSVNGGKSANSTAGGDSALQRQWLQDMCETLTQCCCESRHDSSNSSKGHSGEADTTAAAAAAAAHSTPFTAQQLMWLVETALQLGVAAARHGLHDQASTVLHSVLHTCSFLQQQQPQQSMLHHEDTNTNRETGRGYDTSTAHANLENTPATPLGTAAAAALAARCTSALCVAASLLLQARPAGTGGSTGAAAAAASQQLQKAGGLLKAAQQQLQQQLRSAHSTDTAPAPLAWADAAAVSHASLQPLQLLVIRLSFALAQRQGNEQQVKQQLQLMVQHPLTTPSDLQTAALECLQPGRGAAGIKGSQAVAALAYSHMLRLAAAAVLPDLPAVAAAVAGMLTLVSSDAVKLKAVSKVVEVLGVVAVDGGAAGGAEGTKAGTGVKPYPAKSLQWLVATCWNAAVQSSISGDSSTAVQYLQLVDALADFQQQQQQQQTHWLLGSPQYKQLWALLVQPKHKQQQQQQLQPQLQQDNHKQNLHQPQGHVQTAARDEPAAAAADAAPADAQHVAPADAAADAQDLVPATQDAAAAAGKLGGSAPLAAAAAPETLEAGGSQQDQQQQQQSQLVECSQSQPSCEAAAAGTGCSPSQQQQPATDGPAAVQVPASGDAPGSGVTRSTPSQDGSAPATGSQQDADTACAVSADAIMVCAQQAANADSMSGQVSGQDPAAALAAPAAAPAPAEDKQDAVGEVKMDAQAVAAADATPLSLEGQQHSGQLLSGPGAVADLLGEDAGADLGGDEVQPGTASAAAVEAPGSQQQQQSSPAGGSVIAELPDAPAAAASSPQQHTPLSSMKQQPETSPSLAAAGGAAAQLFTQLAVDDDEQGGIWATQPEVGLLAAAVAARRMQPQCRGRGAALNAAASAAADDQHDACPPPAAEQPHQAAALPDQAHEDDDEGGAAGDDCSSPSSCPMLNLDLCSDDE